MMDENFDRIYQAGRADLNAGIDRGLHRLAADIAKGFEVLHKIAWSAPWRSGSEDVGHA